MYSSIIVYPYSDSHPLETGQRPIAKKQDSGNKENDSPQHETQTGIC